MRDQHGPLRLIFSVMALFVSLGVVGFPTDTSAMGGTCGGAVLCECGDRVDASRTLVCGVDPITVTTCGVDVPNANGLNINGSQPTDPNIALNLGGCTLRGNGSAATAGVRIGFYSNATVTSGRITGFGTGVVVDDASDSQVTLLQLRENVTHGILVSDGNDNVIERNIVSRMKCAAAGIAVNGGRNEIRLNRVEYSAFDGTKPGAITVTGGLPSEPGANIVSRNVVQQNAICDTVPVAGIMLRDNGATVELNKSDSNDGDGFDIQCSDALLPGNTVRRNTALRNDLRLKNWGNGFTLERCGSQIGQNVSSYNDGFGIFEVPSSDPPNTYTNNRCTGNRYGKSSPPGLCN